MKEMDRRDFLKMAGAGTVAAAAAAAIPVAGYFAWSGKETIRFRAVAGMPRAPLPTYASYVIEGTVDLGARKGTLAKSVYAGAPDARSGVVFPGTERTVEVTDVRKAAGELQISGRVVGSSLLPGESPSFSMLIDRSAGLAHADFLGSQVTMKLDH